jgi:hypothetical protein
MWFLVFAGILVVAAAAVGIAFAVGGGSESSGGSSGSCVRQTFPPMGRSHVQSLAEDFEYNSVPPTSGPHAPVPAVWSIYDRPVDQLAVVHNLEHGGVVVQYGDQVPDATVQEITAWYQDDPNGLVVAPLPALGNRIALTAWTHLATCTDFDEGAFDDFVSDYRGPDGDAPEKIPLEALQPGST